MPKDRDYLVRSIELRRWRCKHLYSQSGRFWGRFARSIAPQTPALDGTMSFRLGLGSDRVNHPGLGMGHGAWGMGHGA
ncbi:MAG: hypothetical protein WBA89_06345, partial [Microcoleus sp.]